MSLWIATLLYQLRLPEDWAWDLALGLVLSALSLAVTYLLIERWIKEQDRKAEKRLKELEEKRWGPAKDVLHASLLDAIDDLLKTVLSYKAYKQAPSEVIVFGKAPVYGPLTLKISKTDFTLERESDLMAKPDSFNQREFYVARREVDRIIDTSAFLLEPDLLHLLFKLDSQIKLFTRAYLPVTKDTKQDDFSSYLHSMANTALGIKALLEQIGKRLPFQEWLDGLSDAAKPSPETEALLKQIEERHQQTQQQREEIAVWVGSMSPEAAAGLNEIRDVYGQEAYLETAVQAANKLYESHKEALKRISRLARLKWHMRRLLPGRRRAVPRSEK